MERSDSLTLGTPHFSSLRTSNTDWSKIIFQELRATIQRSFAFTRVISVIIIITNRANDVAGFAGQGVDPYWNPVPPSVAGAVGKPAAVTALAVNAVGIDVVCLSRACNRFSLRTMGFFYYQRVNDQQTALIS